MIIHTRLISLPTMPPRDRVFAPRKNVSPCGRGCIDWLRNAARALRRKSRQGAHRSGCWHFNSSERRGWTKVCLEGALSCLALAFARASSALTPPDPSGQPCGLAVL